MKLIKNFFKLFLEMFAWIFCNSCNFTNHYQSP